MNQLLFPVLPVGSLMAAFHRSTFSGQMIVLTLFAMSVGAWTIMITKFILLARARAATARFLRAFREEAQPTALFSKRQRMPDTPLDALYEAGCRALSGELAAAGIESGTLRPEAFGEDEDRPLNVHQLESVRAAMERAVADQALELESLMGLLATAVSAGPFLGLLGTVWGVMDAFGDMGSAGAVTLAAVAPGVSGALVTTVIGLLVALPSSIGYNMLTARIRYLCVQMDNFAQEFTIALQQRFSLPGE